MKRRRKGEFFSTSSSSGLLFCNSTNDKTKTHTFVVPLGGRPCPIKGESIQSSLTFFGEWEKVEREDKKREFLRGRNRRFLISERVPPFWLPRLRSKERDEEPAAERQRER
jgi:hypothetical protein